MPWRYPAKRIDGPVGMREVECRLEAVRVIVLQFQLMNVVVDQWQHDVRRKRQRGDRGPGVNSASVDSVMVFASPHDHGKAQHACQDELHVLGHGLSVTP